jgi:RNA recognition motif-containing protein
LKEIASAPVQGEEFQRFKHYELTSRSELDELLHLEEEEYFHGRQVPVERAEASPTDWRLMRLELNHALDLEEEEYFHGDHRRAVAASDGLSSEPEAASSADQDASQLNQDVEQSAPLVTTVMIRNITCKYSPEQVRQFLDGFGLAGTYDFFYLPMNRSGAANLGYCFVNFRQPGFVDMCISRLQGRALGQSQSSKTCDVTIAQQQGLAVLEKHFNKKSVLKSAHPPLFL